MGGLLLAVAGLLSAQISGQFSSVNTRIDDMGTRIDELRADVRDLRADHVRFDARLDAVEVAVGRVDQRLSTIERVVLSAPTPGG